MLGTRRRLLRRGLLLALGIAGAWLIGALIGPGTPAASAATPSASPTATPNPLTALLAPITQTVDAVLPAVPGLVSSVSAPILRPVGSQLGVIPLGGVLSPPPVPIQLAPELTPVAGALPIGVSAPSVAELTGAHPADQPHLGEPQPAASPMGSGSVPSHRNRSPDPSPVPLPSSPAAPALPVAPLPPTLPAPGPDGPGSNNGAGLALRGGIDTVVPIPSPRRSPAASRAPPGPDSITPCLIADEPSYSPD